MILILIELSNPSLFRLWFLQFCANWKIYLPLCPTFKPLTEASTPLASLLITIFGSVSLEQASVTLCITYWIFLLNHSDKNVSLKAVFQSIYLIMYFLSSQTFFHLLSHIFKLLGLKIFFSSTSFF